MRKISRRVMTPRRSPPPTAVRMNAEKIKYNAVRDGDGNPPQNDKQSYGMKPIRTRRKMRTTLTAERAKIGDF